MKPFLPAVALVGGLSVSLFIDAQNAPPPYTAATLPTSSLLSEADPTLRVTEDEIRGPLTLIAYGDQRFTDQPTRSQPTPGLSPAHNSQAS